MNSPSAKFTMPVIPNVSVIPSAMMPYIAPMMAPFSTCPRTSCVNAASASYWGLARGQSTRGGLLAPPLRSRGDDGSPRGAPGAPPPRPPPPPNLSGGPEAGGGGPPHGGERKGGALG